MRKRRRAAERGKTFWETVNKRLEIDGDMLCGGSLIEIKGRSRVEVGGVEKIVAYETEQVILALRKGTVSVTGARLECIFYRRGEAAVEGQIHAVSFGD
ncbi:MAG: YabP/YqfC family sporulation protein [Clostridia bacterium]|nr:YabP/YqfC family sporulation protein [Clostridia bacterium]